MLLLAPYGRSAAIMFWAIGINITSQWRQNSFGPKSNFSPYRHFFGNALRYVYFGCLSFEVRSFTEIYKRNFEISLNFYKKHINYAWIVLDLMLDLMQTNFLPFRGSRTVFIAHIIRFANDLYTLYNRLKASRLAPFRENMKTCESVKHNWS